MNARFFESMLCLAVAKLPEGPEWQLEKGREPSIEMNQTTARLRKLQSIVQEGRAQPSFAFIRGRPERSGGIRVRNHAALKEARQMPAQLAAT